uniref:Uncharacterized protein n=1 Tax=Acrobeloides nanus TaxID=290746 RepID=A0A914DTH3_9BILA
MNQDSYFNAASTSSNDEKISSLIKEKDRQKLARELQNLTSQINEAESKISLLSKETKFVKPVETRRQLEAKLALCLQKCQKREYKNYNERSSLENEIKEFKIKISKLPERKEKFETEEEFEEACQKFQERQAMASEVEKNRRYLRQIQNAIFNHNQGPIT